VYNYSLKNITVDLSEISTFHLLVPAQLLHLNEFTSTQSNDILKGRIGTMFLPLNAHITHNTHMYKHTHMHTHA